MLADGRLHLTAIAKLAPHLTRENRDRLLARAVHKSKREIEELVAEIAPRPDVPAFLRKLPERQPAASASTAPPEDASAGPAALASCRDLVDPLVAEREQGAVGRASDACQHRLRPDAVVPPVSGLPGTLPSAARAVVEPLAPGRYKVQFTASAALREKLERLHALVRSSMPGADLAAVIETAVTEALERLEARRFGRAKAPSANGRQRPAGPPAETASRHVPAAVRRAVHERDGGRCRFVDQQGQRCTARSGLEFHHRHPFGMGGGHSAANVSLLCHQHNRHMAEIDYGGIGTARQRRAKSPPGPVRQA
jgi:5-methylcytosine-specific restriction endonuclease McrA